MRFRARAKLVLAALLVGALAPVTPLASEPGAHAEPVSGLEIVIAPAESQLTVVADVLAQVLVRNTGSAPVAAGRAQLSVATEPMTGSDELETPGAIGASSRPLLVVPTPALEPGEETSFTAQISASSLPFTPLSAPGVYPTEVRWSETGIFSVDTTSPAYQSTPVLWRSYQTQAQLNLATIVPLLFPHTTAPPLTPEELDEQLLAGDRVTTILDFAERSGALVAVDPKIIGSVNAVGAAGSVSVHEIADRIAALDTFALQYADADPATQLTMPTGDDQAAPELLTPGNLTPLARHYRPAEGDIGSLPPRYPRIVRWPTTLNDAAWPAPGTVTPEITQRLAEAGLTTLVLSGGNASGAAHSVVSHSAGESTLYVSHERLETTATALATAETPAERALAQGNLSALTLLLGSDLNTDTPDAPEAPTVLLAVAREAASAPGAAALFGHLEALPWVTFTATADLTPGEITWNDPVPLTEAHELLETALESESSVASAARMLVDPQLLIDYERDRLLTLVGAGVVTDPLARDAAMSAVADRDEALRSGVRIIDTEHTRLLGTSSRIPVQMRNTLPFDAVVRGTASAGSAALIVNDAVIDDTVIPTKSTVTHLVPVTSRVSGGESSLNVTIVDTHEGKRIDTQQFAISVSSGIEAIVLGVFIAIAVLLFVLGALRSYRRHRPVS